MDRKGFRYIWGLAALFLIAAGVFIARGAQSSGLAGVQWIQIGPAPLQIDANQNYQGAGPDSGQVVDIAIDPRGSSDQTIYIATNDGGVWKTIDGGATWQPKSDALNSLSIGALELDPGNPSIVYAGTGNLFNNGFFKGIGIYKSLDGGDSWTLVGNTVLGGKGINRIVMPAANQLLVATNAGLYLSVDGGQNFGSNSPTFNNNAAVLAGYISDLRIDNTTATTIRAAVNGSGIFVSTDSGATWGSNLWTASNGSPQQSNPGQIGYVAFAQLGSTIYTTVQNTSPSPSRFLGMWVSTNSGGTWVNLPAANTPGNADGNSDSGCQCGYDQTLGIDPLNVNTVYIGFQEVWVSTDGGASFGGPPAASSSQVHWDQHALVFSPPSHVSGSPTPFYVGEDGGIAYTNDTGTTWSNLNGTAGGTGAIATNLFRGIDIGRGNSTNNKYTYGGTQDTGTIEFTPSFSAQTWHLGIDGDGGAVATDPCDPTHTVGNDDGGFIETTTSGSGWNFTFASLPTNPGVGALAFDQTCDNILYAGVGSVNAVYFRTTPGDTFGLMHSIAPGSVGIDAIATIKIDKNVVWVGRSDGQLDFTTNALLGASATWTTVAVPGAISGQGVSSLAIDPSNTKTVYVTYPGFSGIDPNTAPTEHVFMTTDSGVTWTDISGVTGGGSSNLPDLPINSIAIDPATSPHTIVVGSDAGVLQSGDLGNTWQVLGLGMPTVQVTSVQLDASASPPLLRAGTYGRSTFELDPASTGLIAVNAPLAFGGVCAGANSTQIVQIFNVGVADLHISSFSRVSGSADFAIVSGPGTPVTVSPDSSISYTIQFTPTGTGNESAIFQINSDDPFTPEKQLTATGIVNTPAIATVIAGGGNFGDVCLTAFSDLNLTISNSGQCPLKVSGISSTSTEFTPAGAVSYPLVVSPGTATQVPIRFQPLTTGAKVATITIASNDPVNPSSPVLVTGNVPTGTIRVTGSTAFGNVCGGANATLSVAINNVGKCNLDVASATVSCPDFTIVNNPFPAAVSPDSQVSDTIEFTPTSSGPKSCSLIITSDDPVTPVVTLPLTATTPLAAITVPAALTFAPTVIQNQGACSSQLGLPIANAGSCSAKLNSIALSGPNASEFALAGLPALPLTLGAGQQAGSGDLDAILQPVSIARTKTATVTVIYVNDPITGATATQTVPLCGEGTQRGLRLLVTVGGVPASLVKDLKLYGPLNTTDPDDDPRQLRDHKHNVALTSVTGTGACPSFQFHREYGAITNPQKLPPGLYDVVARVKIGKKTKQMKAKVSIGTCGFDQNVVITF